MSENIEENKVSILFVDDEKNILSSLNRLFRSEGYDIHLANSGRMGLEIMETENISLVVSDMRMPEMNGAQFLEAVYNKWPSTVRILLTGFSEISSTIDAINKGNIYKYISKPWEENDLKQTVRNAIESKKIELERDRLLALTSKQNEELKEFNTNLESMVKSRTSELNQTMGMLEASYETLKESYTSTVKVFSNIIEMRAGTLSGHSKIVSETSKAVAIKYGLTKESAQQISYAGLLRDIGKIGFPDNLLNKPQSSLSPDNQYTFAKHPVIGEGILMAIEPLKEAAKIIRNYRERFDGKGYPDKLSGSDIPVGSRILAIVSDFDALQVGAITKTRLTNSRAMEFISANKNSRYDPELVDIFFSIINVNEKDNNIKEQEVILMPASKLEQNMVLARDLLTNDGVLLLSEGHRLGEHMIKQIKNLEGSLNEELVIYIKS